MTSSNVDKEGKAKSSREVQIDFGEDTLEIVEKISRATGRNPAEVISDALGLYDWAIAQRFKGRSVGSVEGGKAIDEVVIPIRDNGRAFGV